MSEPRKSFYVLLPLISILIGLLLVELGLTFFYPIPYSLEKNMYFEPDPYTGFRHRPEGSGHYPTGIEARANSRGMRDDEIAVPKPADVYRILVIGDSFTVGANVEQDEAYPQVLEQLLNTAGGPVIEVVNAGTGGWSPYQYARYLEHYGAALEPDLVLVGVFVGNDVFIDRFSSTQLMSAVLGRRVRQDAAQAWWIKPKILAYENSHIARALMSKAPDSMDFGRRDCAEFNDYYIAVQKNRVATHLAVPSPEQLQLGKRNVAELAAMRAMAATMGAEFAVLILPDENQINPALQQRVIAASELDLYDFDQPQQWLNEQLAPQSITTLDLLDVIRADERCLYMNDTHWIPAGHELVAEQVLEFLRARQLVP
jgi:hypothetical protein